MAPPAPAYMQPKLFLMGERDEFTKPKTLHSYVVRCRLPLKCLECAACCNPMQRATHSPTGQGERAAVIKHGRHHPGARAF